jgi:hypothetical protein
MNAATREIAEAFSGHRFVDTIPHLAEDITWNLVGDEPLVGSDAVISACEETAAELADVTTRFLQFRSIVAEDCVVVDSVADYTDSAGDTTTVASCDIYDFTNGKVSGIRSYNIELEA